MFSQLSSGSKKQDVVATVSVLAHCLLLAWILHSPKPIFVEQSSVVKGQPGGTFTRIYFGGVAGITQEVPSHVTLPHPAPSSRRLPTLAARSKEGSTAVAALRSNEPLGGSPYGSLSYGSFSGSEVRPALPVFSPDPAIDRDLARSLSGDVIIEVTIDEAGHITDVRLLQSVNAPVDQKVLEAVNRWQFEPATRNGVPIPSKQDVYYHFPR